MKLVEKPGQAPERVCLYGPPKVGKTRTATSLPWGEHWGERAVLIASDVGGPNVDAEKAAAAALKPVLEANRDRLLVVVPDGGPTWMEESVQIALKRDWPDDVGTIIWDTMTTTSRFLLREYADTGVFQAKHSVQLGSKQTGSWHTSPDRGDYGAVQNTLAFLHEHIWTSPLNLIIIFHDDFLEPESGSLDGLIGGPATAGKKAIRWIPSKYDTVLFQQRKQQSADSSTIIVNTQQRGIWVAGVRGTNPQVPAQVKLQEDPVHLWNELKG